MQTIASFGSPVAQPGHDLAVLERAGQLARFVGPGQIIGMRLGGLALPGNGSSRLQRLDRFGECGGRRLNRERRLIDAAKLFRTRMHVDQLLLRGRNIKQRVGRRRHFRHAAADEQNDIGAVDARLQARARADAEIAGIVRVIGVDERRSAERGRDRQVEPLGKPRDPPGRLVCPARTAENDERRLGAGKHGANALDIRRRGPAHRRLDTHRVRNGRGLGQHVLRQRDHDGTGTALHGDAEGPRDQLRNAVGTIDLDRPFRHGAEHSLVVELLKRLALAHAGVDLADEQDHRRRILHRDVDAVAGVGGAGAAGDEADSGAARELAVGLRHHRGAALGAADHDVDRAVMQRIERREVALARHAGDALDALRDQLIDQDLAPGAGVANGHDGSLEALAMRFMASRKSCSELA
ncbi:hypothetical protein ACVWZZ_001996 [Bradyrhizobium sp. LM6.10]